MAIAFAVLIAACSIGIAALIGFAGGMRTSGSTASDRSGAVTVLVLGLSAAALVAFTHWHPIGW